MKATKKGARIRLVQPIPDPEGIIPSGSEGRLHRDRTHDHGVVAKFPGRKQTIFVYDGEYELPEKGSS